MDLIYAREQVLNKMENGKSTQVEVNMDEEEEKKKKEKDTINMPVLPKPLTLEEKKYLVAVERGDMVHVRR